MKGTGEKLKFGKNYKDKIMTFNELLEKVRGLAGKADVSDKDFLAVQINITGKKAVYFTLKLRIIR